MIGLDVPADLTRGALIGFATLVDVIDDSDSPWAQPGQIHWVEWIPSFGHLGAFGASRSPC
jgi:hypothetical protein